MTVIPNNYEPLDFQNNPETEDLIRGEDLKNGMVVLQESTITRGYETDLANAHPLARNRMNETSRWCKVTDLRVTENHVDFFGVYHDGTKSHRTYAKSYSWFVKKDSIPADRENDYQQWRSPGGSGRWNPISGWYDRYSYPHSWERAYPAAFRGAYTWPDNK